MDETKESKFKIFLDNILIYNLFILSINGFLELYSLFQKLWYPIFIPSLSLFFTAILIEAIYNRATNGKNK